MGTTEDPEQKLVRSALMLQGKVALVPLPDCSVELTWRSPSATEWYHYDGRRSACDFLVITVVFLLPFCEPCSPSGFLLCS
jgi:hypothetical protein